MTAHRTSRPKDRKQTILRAAAELFAAHGYSAVGVDDIAAQVGITGSAIYRHFRSKDAILVALLERTAAVVVERVESARDDKGFDAVAEAVVSLALQGPAELATYLRERRRLGRAVLGEVATTEARLTDSLGRALLTVTPGLDLGAIDVRARAIIGLISAGALHPRDVGPPRVKELLMSSARAIAAVPRIATAAPTSSGDGSRVWRPTPSKHDEILGAALTLFRARGFTGVGIDEIGEAAGISGPTVYHYFPSKAALLVDAFDRAGERVSAGVTDALRDASSAHDALERLAASYVSVAADSVDLIVVTSQERVSSPDGGEPPRLARRRRLLRDAWRGVATELRPELPEQEVRFLVRTVFPLVHHAVQAPAATVEHIRALAGAHITGGSSAGH
jgi:AcrR family transcriptional regulator